MYREIPMDSAIKNRIAIFSERPGEEELAAELGYGLMGGSNRSLQNDDQFFKISPQPIPVRAFTIFMYSFLAVVSILTFWFDGDKILHVMNVVAAIFIIPCMIGVLSWINQMTGTEPYIIFDKQANLVELPRLSMKFPKNEIREIVFLDRFVENNEYWQIAMLVEERSDRWLYVHLYNSASSGSVGWFGFKDDYHQLALSLGIGLRRLRYSRKESKLLSTRSAKSYRR